MPESEINTVDPNLSISACIESQKARMLISLLGADFTKSSNHPFFERLALAAVKPDSETSQKIDVKKSLRNLIDSIGDTNAQKEPAHKTDTQLKNFAIDETLNEILSETEILKQQHPVLIAAYLLKSPKITKSTILKQLSGATARQVAIHLGLFARTNGN